jgi:DnaK suppressor protein
MINIQIYKTLLETEKDELVSELGAMGIKDPVTGDYTVMPENNEIEADESDIATRDEEFEEDSALSSTLSSQLEDVENALKKIENGTYGKCEVCSGLIEEDRLMANPSAKTCMDHMNS